MDEVIAVPAAEIHDPLTPITGLTVDEIAAGIPFERAQAQLKSFCGPDTVIVGQGVTGDIEW